MLLRVLAVTLLAVAAGGGSASAATTPTYRILLASNRDGENRAYSILPDGSLLAPLLPPGRSLEPALLSADGGTVAYTNATQALYVSRADGTGLVRVAASGADVEGFSPDAKQLAFTKKGIWIVGTDGRGLRRMTSYDDDGSVDWAPDGKSFVFARYEQDGSYSIVVQPLSGRRRVLFRTSRDYAFSPDPIWSPDGRSIAYLVIESNQRKNGLWVIGRDGKGRHRVAPGLDEEGGAAFVWSPDGRWIADVEQGEDDRLNGLWLVEPSGKRRHRVTPDIVNAFDWSPDATRLAYVTSENVATIVGMDGSQSGELPLGVRLMSWLSWSPDGGRLAFAGRSSDQIDEIWTFGSDLRGLRQVTSEGANGLIGWTQLTPSLPPAAPIPPPERVLTADVVVTDSPVEALSADGPRVAFVTQPTLTDCDHVAVWSPGDRSILRFGHPQAPCSSFASRHIADLVLAGSRLAWSERTQESDACSYELESATLSDPRWQALSAVERIRCDFQDVFALRGDGDLLVFDHDRRLIRIAAGNESCGDLDFTPAICTTLRRDEHYAPVDSVSGRLMAILEPDAVAVVDDKGGLVRVLPFAPGDVNAVRLDGERVVVWRFGVLEAYDVTTGALELKRPMPSGFRLADVDGGIAVLRSTDTVRLLRLDDGRSLTLASGGEPTLADLEPPGLYYSYATPSGGGRVVFIPRAELVAQLGGSVR